MNHTLKALATIGLALTVSIASLPARSADIHEQEQELFFEVDLALLRPAGLVATVAGMAAFLVTLPLAVPTLSVEKSFNLLVRNPARYTFYRELGGTDYHEDERREIQRETVFDEYELLYGRCCCCR